MKLTHPKFLASAPSVKFDLGSCFEISNMREIRFLETLFSHLTSEMKTTFDDFEWWVFANADGKVVPHSLNQTSNKPRILIWMSDEHGTMPSQTILDRYEVVFKSYLSDTYRHNNLFHFPIGYSNNVDVHPVKPLSERPLSVYFDGNLNKNRASIYREFSGWLGFFPVKWAIPILSITKRLVPQFLKLDFSNRFKDSKITFYLGFGKGDTSEYSKCLSQAKIALCPGGFQSSETYRLMESLRAGAVVVAPTLPHTYFYRNSPIVQVESWEQGIRVVEELLRDEKQLTARQEASVKWWQEVLSEAAIAKYITKSVLSIRSPASCP